jgi:hypothetical protein
MSGSVTLTANSSIIFLLRDDGVDISGAVLPSDAGWSVL